MDQSQILQIQNFIKIAHSDVGTHKEHRDHASQRVLMYSYGRVVGAYAMFKEGIYPDLDAKVQLLEECYHEAMSLTLHKN